MSGLITGPELYRATLDSVAVTEETNSDGMAALRAAGLDPLQTTKAARNIVSGFPEQIARLQAEGMSYRDALNAVLATTWIEGCVTGCIASRAKAMADG